MFGSYIEKLEGSPLKKFFRLLSLDRQDIVLVYLYSLINALVGLSLPLGIQAIMTTVTVNSVTTSLIVLIVVVLVGILITSMLNVFQLTIMERLQQRIFTRATFEFASRIPRIKIETLIKEYSPELMNRFFDIMTIQKGLPKLIIDFTASVLQIFFSLILLAFYHPLFAFYGLFIVAILIVFIRLTTYKGLKTSMYESKYKYQAASWLEELARTMNIFKLAGYTDLPLKKTDKVVAQYLESRTSHFKILINQYWFIVGFKFLMTGGILIIGTALLVNQQINIGQFVASEIVIIIILGAAEKLHSGLEVMYDVLTGVEKISAITDKEIENDHGIAFEDVDDGKGVKFEFRKVSYEYQINKHKAVNEVSFVIKSGQKVCFAGYSASGTSTMINLCASMMHNYTGSILVNDLLLKNLNLISLRSYVGEKLAQNEILNGTIAENISMDRDDITFKDVIDACEKVNLRSFVENLPLGFDTPIVQNDMTLPFSITAKINLARSVAEKPRLFLMDKPLQNLDKQDKVLISDYLTDNSNKWTLIVASNDIAMASRCDKIYIMKDGHVIDSGTFEEIQSLPYFDEIFEK